MKHAPAIASLVGTLVAGVITCAAEQKTAGPAAEVLRYSEVVNVPPPAGTTPTRLRFEIKDWYFVRAEQGVKLPAAGFYIAQLKSGQIDTEIAGKREHRVAGDYWTVPVGTSMTVEFPPHGQAAQIHTVAITPGARARVR
jgi:hypothetical protein